MCNTLPVIRGPELILQGCHLCQFHFPLKETRLFSEPFLESIQRVLLRNPGLGAALIASLFSIALTEILRVQTLNSEDLDTHSQEPTSATRTLWLGCKSP